MEKYELTVVTTTYNQENYIRECIDSILSQKTSFKFLLIVSNDNSTDNTKLILKGYQEKYPNKIKIINRDKNLGPMDNFISTLNEVHTKYVALCDGDDYWTDNTKLQQQYDFLEKNKDYNICFHQTKIVFEDESESDLLHPINIKSTLLLDDLIKENFIPANTVVYRWKYKKDNSLINDFPKNIVPGDYYLHLIHANNSKIGYINKTMSVYRRQKHGMWYLTTQKDKQDLFYLKYGIKYYNFFKYAEIKLKKVNIFKPQKDWILKEYTKVIIKKKKILELVYIIRNEYNSNFDVISAALNELNKFDKFFYFLVKKYCFIRYRSELHEL